MNVRCSKCTFWNPLSHLAHGRKRQLDSSVLSMRGPLWVNAADPSLRLRNTLHRRATSHFCMWVMQGLLFILSLLSFCWNSVILKSTILIYCCITFFCMFFSFYNVPTSTMNYLTIREKNKWVVFPLRVSSANFVEAVWQPLHIFVQQNF